MTEGETLHGVIHFFAETGTEGGYWAFQDGRFIDPVTVQHPHGSWDYEGLYILHDEDYLTIFAQDDRESVIWEGVIELHQHALFSQTAGGGYWIHADQDGVDREEWFMWFWNQHPAKLVTGPNQPERA